MTPRFSSVPRLLLFGGWVLTLGACAAARPCRENPGFQQAFFHHVDVVETYSWERLTGAPEYTLGPEDFFRSLEFIQAYTPVAMGEVLNYEAGYPNLAQFQRDKQRWLKWYAAHKCANLQLDR